MNIYNKSFGVTAKFFENIEIIYDKPHALDTMSVSSETFVCRQ